MELLHAQLATPGALGRSDQWRRQTVHVIATITIVTEQQLVVVVRCSTNGAELTLYALPAISFHRYNHVGRELQTGRMT